MRSRSIIHCNGQFEQKLILFLQFGIYDLLQNIFARWKPMWNISSINWEILQIFMTLKCILIVVKS